MALTGDKKREYQLQWIKDRRDKGLAILGGICAECGSSDNLEFDHIDPKKKTANMARLWSCSWTAIEAELVKCQLLCTECHLAKTVEQFTTKAHGTPSMYKNHKCRCAICRAWKSTDNAKRYR